MTVDYPVTRRIPVTSASELSELFRDRPHHARRLIGSGSAQSVLPVPGEPVEQIDLSGLDRIERLEPDDLTCTVEPGVTRAALDDALEPHGVCLPCPGSGTLGGMIAADLWAPLAPGALSARSLLLGFDAVLGDGTPFKSGARVVKSVAGFDLQKLFTGSRGRLFAATRLHLKLRPRPPATSSFAVDLDGDAAIDLFRTLRTAATPPTELWLERTTDRWRVHGTLAGNPRHLAQFAERHRLGEPAESRRPRLEADAGGETVQGILRPSRVRELLSQQVDGDFAVSGSGQFVVRGTPEACDSVLATTARLEGHAEIRGGEATRRGTATPLDPRVRQLTDDLRSTLDPAGMLR